MLSDLFGSLLECFVSLTFLTSYSQPCYVSICAHSLCRKLLGIRGPQLIDLNAWWSRWYWWPSPFFLYSQKPRILWERSNSKIDEAITWRPHWPTGPQDTIKLTNGPFRINHTYFAHEIPIFAHTYIWGGAVLSTKGEKEQNTSHLSDPPNHRWRLGVCDGHREMHRLLADCLLCLLYLSVDKYKIQM